MMKRVVGCIVVTLCLTVSWLYVRPFDLAGRGLSRIFSAERAEAMLGNVYRDPAIHEMTNGEAPLAGLRALGKRWGAVRMSKRVVLMGNSQTYSIILAPDEDVPSQSPKTYVDLLATNIGAQGGWSLYSLSAPNLSYPEALWYVEYLSAVSETHPTELVLQLNYESFRKSGIRDGMLELLEEPRFASAIDELASSSAPYAAVMAEAKRRYAELKRERTGNGDRQRTPEDNYGQRVERNLREWLSAQQGWEAKHLAKKDFLNLLYLSRVYLLRITPTTPRALGGATYEINVACLDSLAAECRANRIVLKLFLAPQNPHAQLWRTTADRAKYRGTARKIAERYALTLVDLESVVPARDWGFWADGPDPIHFGVRGHQVMAEAVLRSGLLF